MDETTQTYEPTMDAPSLPDDTEDEGHVRYLTDDEARAVFDETARYYMGISGEEFLRRWDAGEWQDDPDHSPVMNVVSSLSLVR